MHCYDIMFTKHNEKKNKISCHLNLQIEIFSYTQYFNYFYPLQPNTLYTQVNRDTKRRRQSFFKILVNLIPIKKGVLMQFYKDFLKIIISPKTYIYP